MTKPTVALTELAEKGADADLLQANDPVRPLTGRRVRHGSRWLLD